MGQADWWARLMGLLGILLAAGTIAVNVYRERRTGPWIRVAVEPLEVVRARNRVPESLRFQVLITNTGNAEAHVNAMKFKLSYAVGSTNQRVADEFEANEPFQPITIPAFRSAQSQQFTITLNLRNPLSDDFAVRAFAYRDGKKRPAKSKFRSFK